MKLNKIILIAGFTLLAAQLKGQVQFLQSGKIEFERKTNTHRLYYSGEDSWMEEMKKYVPQFKTDYFELHFNSTRSLYKPGRESDDKRTGFFEAPGSENVVFKDLSKQQFVSQKKVFESLFLVSDSMPSLEWKIEGETRTIAGFECRKAITRICDSVVVVAFYTDEIIPSSGPESFHGLPGMILGLAIPRLYTTWFATKVELLSDAEIKKIAAPSKGRKASEKEMIQKLDAGIKDWGEEYRARSIWSVSL